MRLTHEARVLAGKWDRLPMLIAHEFATDPSVVSDLVSVGHESLCRAAMAWKTERRVRFQTFAGLCIRRDYRRAIAGWARRQRLETSYGLLEALPPDCAAEVAMASVEVERRLGVLPEELRQVVVLHVVEQLSLVDVGKRLGYSGVTAWTRYHKALEILRAEEVQGREKPCEQAGTL